MTSINFMNKPPVYFVDNEVPEVLGKDEIVVVAGGPWVLSEIPLGPAESHRAAAMSSVEVRERFTAARRILRSVLSGWISVPPPDLEIDSDEHGKPRLLMDDPISFSITHSCGSVAVAFSRQPVGIDLECEREGDFRALASRFFSPEEAAVVASGVSGNPNLFFRLWTCREAAVKADGRGLSKLLGITRAVFPGESYADGLEILIGSERWHTLHWKRGDTTHVALSFRETPSLISWCDLR